VSWKGSPGTPKSWLTQAAGVSLGLNKSFRTHQPPYLTRRRLVTAWQETKKLVQEEMWMDNVRKDLMEKTIGNYQDWWSKKRQKRSLDESYESLVVGIADRGEKRREEDTS